MLSLHYRPKTVTIDYILSQLDLILCNSYFKMFFAGIF